MSAYVHTYTWAHVHTHTHLVIHHKFTVSRGILLLVSFHTMNGIAQARVIIKAVSRVFRYNNYFIVMTSPMKRHHAVRLRQPPKLTPNPKLDAPQWTSLQSEQLFWSRGAALRILQVCVSFMFLGTYQWQKEEEKKRDRVKTGKQLTLSFVMIHVFSTCLPSSLYTLILPSFVRVSKYDTVPDSTCLHTYVKD